MQQDHPLSRTNNFDLIRLLAALQVLYTHGATWLNLPRADGLLYLINMFSGVPVFFVVSGFLVTDSLLRNRDHLGRFATSRSLRIFPGLWCNLAFITLLLTFDHAIPDREAYAKFFSIQMLVGSDWIAGWLFGSYPIVPHALQMYPSGVLWTLSVEIGFYFLVVGVVGLTSRNLLRCNIAMALAFICSIGSSMLMGHLASTGTHQIATFFLMNTPMAFFWMFLIGSAARVNWNALRSFFEGKAAAWFACYAIVYMIGLGHGISVNDFQKIDALSVIKICLMGACVISFAYTWPHLARPLRGNDISYGTYLYHMQVVTLMMAFGFTAKGYLWLVLAGATAALAAASWLLIERPALRLKTLASQPPYPSAAEPVEHIAGRQAAHGQYGRRRGYL